MGVQVRVFGRLEYPHLHQPHQFRDEKVKGEGPFYRTGIILTPDEPTLAHLNQVCCEMIANELKIQADSTNVPFKQCNAQDPEFIQGCYRIKTKTQYAPKIFAANPQNPNALIEIEDPNRPADGDWCFVIGDVYCYNTGGNAGAGFGLRAVMFARPGEQAIGRAGGIDGQAAFGDVMGQVQALPVTQIPTAQAGALPQQPVVQQPVVQQPVVQQPVTQAGVLPQQAGQSFPPQQ